MDKDDIEKEAEQYGLSQALWCESDSDDLKDAFIAGAEFGYNKARTDHTKWHKVADGDYPPIENYIYTIDVLTDKGDIVYYVYNYNRWCVEPSGAVIEPPIAWCEIPEYTEEK